MKELPFKKKLIGISDKTIKIHHDKLYVGYVAKKEEIGKKLSTLSHGGDVTSANQTYSELRALKDSETFAINAVYLHEWYFDCLGGDGKAEGPLVDALAKKYGSLKNFLSYFNACGTTAAAHDNLVAISVYQYPEPIQQAVLMQAMRWWKRRESAFQDAVGNPETGMVNVFKGLDPDIKLIVDQYKRKVW